MLIAEISLGEVIAVFFCLRVFSVFSAIESFDFFIGFVVYLRTL